MASLAIFEDALSIFLAWSMVSSDGMASDVLSKLGKAKDYVSSLWDSSMG